MLIGLWEAGVGPTQVVVNGPARCRTAAAAEITTRGFREDTELGYRDFAAAQVETHGDIDIMCRLFGGEPEFASGVTHRLHACRHADQFRAVGTQRW